MKEVREKATPDEIQRLKRSPQYVNANSRFLGITVTIFILILTVKSELLSSWIIASQLVLAIPFSIATLAAQAKIVDLQSLRKYYPLTKTASGIAMAFLYNVIGLLTVRYIFLSIGLIFFSLFIIFELKTLYGHFVSKEKDKILRDLFMLAILICGGVLPAFGIINF